MSTTLRRRCADIPRRRFTGAKVHNYFGLCKYLFVYVKKKLYFCTKIATEKQNDR